MIPTVTIDGVPDPLPEGLTVLDVREPVEWQHAHIEGAVHIPLATLPQRHTELPEGQQVLNQNAERFYDEGQDFWPKRYAIWGKLVARQPAQIAYAIVDAKVRDRFLPSVFPPVEADSIDALAVKLGLPVERLAATVATFNNAVSPGTFDHTRLDDCRTTGLAPAHCPNSASSRLIGSDTIPSRITGSSGLSSRRPNSLSPNSSKPPRLAFCSAIAMLRAATASCSE